MSLITMINIMTIIFCAAVLVQSTRMMRSLDAVRSGAMADVVGALDTSTAQARQVLSQLKMVLGECSGNAQTIAEAKKLCEELTVMTGIANATAERIVDAANGARTFKRQASGRQSRA